MIIFPVFIVFSGGWCFVAKHKHLLVMLISLEIMILGLFIAFRIWSISDIGEEFFLLVFLAFAACEGAIGLGVLVGLVRSYGRDIFRRFSILQC